MSLLRVGNILERSEANGPGERFVIWVQGCGLRCSGCVNRQLWPRMGGRLTDVRELARRIHKVDGIRGVTFSGGEPLEQAEAVAELLGLLDRRLDSVMFTGYAWDEIAANPAKKRVLDRVDLVVAGPYLREMASDDNPWAGSKNKTVHALTGRIRVDESPDCRVEVQLRPDGTAYATGFLPTDWRGA